MKDVRETRRARGLQAERVAVNFLESQGHIILNQNVYTRYGEIDVVSMDGSELVFSEVRYRRHIGFVGAAETVNRRKQQKLWKAAQVFLAGWSMPWPRCRFDVISIEGSFACQPKQLKSAFDGTMF